MLSHKIVGFSILFQKKKEEEYAKFFLIDQLIRYKWLNLDSEVALRLTEILLLVTETGFCRKSAHFSWYLLLSVPEIQK
jgi:hypothetical protein